MFSLENGKIIVPRKELNIRATLECGQVFRFTLPGSPPAGSGQGCELISADKKCVIAEEGNRVIVYARERDISYFVRYFDLETSYAPILRELRARTRDSRVLAPGGAAFVEAAFEYGKGLRILRQDPFEMLISFIISTNNNIKRIQGIIERLCAALGRHCPALPAGGAVSGGFTGGGTANGTFYDFPAVEVMAENGEGFYRDLGCGYRAKWLLLAAKKASGGCLASFEELPTPELTAELQTFAGVGPKAADCIALFAYGRYDVFPVDTWVKKLYSVLFAGKPDGNGRAIAPGIMRASGPRDERKEYKGAIAPGIMRENLTACFGRFAGIAQQFLFYYSRRKV
jgi:N-glycosylase/DNA lyase